jgi:class 3 adenylate cyclase
LVTLLFTDIEGGVRLWEADRDAMAAASARHDRIVREQIEASGGHVFKTVGEAHDRGSGRDRQVPAGVAGGGRCPRWHR